MRIRTIKPEFFTHDGLFDLEAESGLPLRVAFIGLWCAADREGRFQWNARRLGAQILPYDQVDFSRVLDALATRGFVVKYACEGRDFGHIPSFKAHQVINNREKASELPEPSKQAVSDACLTREPRVGHAGKAEGKGKEGKGTSSSPSKSDAPISEEAEAFAQWFRTLLPVDRDTTEADLRNWAKTYDDLVRLDNRAPDEIRAVCQWARNDEFWASNFLSACKLRQKDKARTKYYDVFKARMTNEHTNHNRPSAGGRNAATANQNIKRGKRDNSGDVFAGLDMGQLK